MPPATKKPDPQIEDQEEVVVEDDEVNDAEPEAAEEEVSTSELGLPVIDDFLAEPDAGFDYFGTVHLHLKEAGIVKNQNQTAELIKYFDSMIRQSAFENGAHTIKGLGTITTDVRGSVEKVATFDMASKGVKKGDTYTTTPKYAFKFAQNGGAAKWLAECAACEGWEPEKFA